VLPAARKVWRWELALIIAGLAALLWLKLKVF
jgi:hypothetical protein